MIDRYDIWLDCLGESIVEDKDPHGDWVRYEDVEEEIKKLEEQINKFKVMLGYAT